MRPRSWKRFALGALAAAFVIGVVAASAPAGNRSPNAAAVVFPGPTASVTYGKSVAYTATLLNGPSQTSNYTHLFFHDPVPFTLTLGTNGQTTKNFASFKYSNCSGKVSGGEFVSNDLGELRPGDTTTCVIIWQTPAVGSSDDPLTQDDECAKTQDTGGNTVATAPPCITNQPYWTIKEGTGKPGSRGPDTFFTNNVGVHFLSLSDSADARGYEIDGCTTSNFSGALATGPLTSGNIFRASVCVRKDSLPGTADSPDSPGLVQTIKERPHDDTDDAGFTQVAEICIPAPPGQSCDDPWPMDPPGKVKLEFDTKNTPTPTPSDKIDRIFHDDGSGYEDVTDTCEITLINSTKVLIAICPAPTNGRWTGG